MGKNPARVVLPVLVGAGALTGIGALAAPMLAGGAASTAAATGALGGATAGLTGGAGAGAAATGALAGGTAGLAGGTLGAMNAANLGQTLGSVSTGINLASQGLSPFLQQQPGIAPKQFNDGMPNLRSFAQPNY